LTFLLSNPFTPILRQALLWINDLVAQYPLPAEISSFAVAITLIALAIKVVTYPLNAASQRSMRAMQELQPKLKELQERHGDDREQLMQAQMTLYREHGVNPFGGCLPLIIQMVVLIGLYSAIRQISDEGKLTGQRFLWIADLSKCEPSPVCQPADSMLPYAVPILVIVLVVSQMAYQKFLTPPSADPQAQAMASMMRWMPVFFAYIFLYLPAGLVLYYAMFNLISVAQYLAVDRPKKLAPATLPAAGGRPPGDGAMIEKESNHDNEPRRPRRKRKRH